MEAGMKISVVLQAFDKMTSVVNRAVTGAEKKLASFKKTSDNIAKGSFDFGKSAGAFGLGTGALLAAPIKAAADMEKMNIALKTSFQGNEEAAKKAFGIINGFAAKTPYELEEVMTGFIKLKNMGLDPSVEALTAYGNTASAMGKSLNDMVEAVADAATGEFERLKEFGIKASSEGNKVTFMFQGKKTTIRKDAKAIEGYLKQIGLTKFAGGIEAQSKSINGQLSTLSDNLKMTMAKAGNTMIPLLNRIFEKIGPVIDRISNWIDKNPKLTEQILKGVAALAALSLATSGLSFAFGGVFKIFSAFSTIGGGTMKLFGWLTNGATGLGHWIFVLRYRLLQVGQALATVGRFLMANPIILIITGIAVAAFLIYKYWDRIKAFFVRLWGSVKTIFSQAWQWIKNLFLNYHPVGLVIKHWDKISGFFSNLWGKVRNIFSGFFKWFVSLHKMFFNAGVNIVKSIWEGIKTFANKPVEAMKGIVQKVRNLLPFSPAKDGPLKDIHKIKLVETIAQSVKPNALIDRMKNVAKLTFGVMTGNQGSRLSPGGQRAAGGMNVTFNISLNGGATKGDAKTVMDEVKRQFPQLLKQYQDRQNRVSFG